jgi:hypothetical protein
MLNSGGVHGCDYIAHNDCASGDGIVDILALSCADSIALDIQFVKHGR